MKKLLLILSITILISNISLFAQSEKPLSSEEYDAIFNSLMTEKTSLLIEKKTLTAQIDSLNNVLTEMKERLISARSDQLKKKYGSKVGVRIAQGQVWKGMSEKMLEDSWGKPDKITKNKEKWGTFTQWYYGDITYFFRDGIMTDWEEKK